MKIDRWIKEVTPYIAAYVSKGHTFDISVTMGLADYTKFLDEMVAGETSRSKLAIETLKFSVFSEVNVEKDLGL